MDAEAHVAADPVNPMRIFHEFSRQAPRRRDRRRRQRLGRQLVRPPARMRGRHARLALRDAGHDGPRRALCDRREVRAPRPSRDRLRGRRRHADERARRAAHDRALLAGRGATRDSSSPCCTTTTSTRSPGSCVPWAGRRSSCESQALPDMSYADFAAALGLGARPSPTPTSSAAPGRTPRRRPPTVLDVHCDPDVPPIPPHSTLEQMTRRGQGADQGRPEQVGRDQGRAEDQGAAVASE